MDFGFNFNECQIHVNNEIAYFCNSKTCKRPLCMKCLKDHSNFHKNNKSSPRLFTIRDLKEKCELKVQNFIDLALKDIISIENFYIHDYDAKLEKLSNEISRVKTNLMEIIENFFEALKHKIYNMKLEIYEKNHSFVLKSLEEIKKWVNYLNTTKIYLETQPSTDLIISFYQKELNFEYDQIREKTVTTLSPLKREEISINDNVYCLLASELKNHIKLQNEKNLSPFKKAESSQIIDEPNSSFSSGLHKSELLDSKMDNLSINLKNFFSSDCKHKYLHFFQDNTRLLKIIDVDSLYNSISKSCHIIDIPLDIDFEIPAWHKSIITPKGNIYLFGGLRTNEENKELKDIHEFTFEKLKLQRVSEMQIERYGHELCFLNESIYVFGGANDNQGMLKSCERFDCNRKKSIFLNDMLERAFGASSAVYQKKWIFLFGGLLEDRILNNVIQKYIVDENKWELIKIEEQKLLWCSISSIINENEILIFGGYQEDNIGSNFTLLFDIEEKKEEVTYGIKRIDNNVPFSEGFWNNQAIVHQENIFCLQNIQNEEDNTGTNLECRRVIGFDGKEWSVFNRKN